MITQIAGPDGAPFFIPREVNSVTASLIKGEYWEPYLLPLFPLCCRKDRWTVEVGAYIGDHTIALLQHGPVLAIEPQPLPWALLGLNLAVRTFTHPWKTFLYALYSHAQTLGRAPGWEPYHPSNGYQPGAPCGRWADPFDRVIQDETTQPVGFFKVDAQGCDLQVLIGAEQTIARDRPIILCEFEPALAALHGDDAGSYRGWFAQHEYMLAGFLGGNLLGVPAEIPVGPYWSALTDHGVELTR